MLIVISDSTFVTGEAETVITMLRSGLDVFHIRKYGASKEELIAFIRSVPTNLKNRLVLHHDHELGEELGLTRFHFSEQDRVAWQESDWNGVGKQIIYSTSVHTLTAYNTLPSHFAYAFISPVFDSISKTNYQAEKFDLKERTNDVVKLIALGGVDHANVQQAMTWGYDGVALLGAIWRSTDPIAAFKQIRSQLKSDSVLK